MSWLERAARTHYEAAWRPLRWADLSPEQKLLRCKWMEPVVFGMAPRLLLEPYSGEAAEEIE